MELKNQILLVILIPIMLIILQAIFQVGVLGFINIPSFQNQLLDFHIKRQLNGLNIELSILQQEIYIQYQSYFNQIIGVAAHLRFYGFGEFHNYSNWTLSENELNPHNFMKGYSNSSHKVDWYHEEYNNLASMDNLTKYRLYKAAQSLALSEIIINNSRTLLDDLDPSVLQNSNQTIEPDEHDNPINYESAIVACANSFIVRYPPFTKSEIEYQKQYGLQQIKAQNIDLYDENTFVSHEFLIYVIHRISPQSTSNQTSFLNIQEFYCKSKQILVKVNNDYLTHLQHVHADHDDFLNYTLFVSLYDKQLQTITPEDYHSVQLEEAFVMATTDIKNISAFDQDKLQQLRSYIDASIDDLEKDKNKKSANFTIQISGRSFYFELIVISTQSNKHVKVVTDPNNGRRYLVVDPDGNKFIYPTLIVLHAFDKTKFVEELYEDSSLKNIRLLEIIVFISIIILSIVIFVGVWYIASKIGQSFEQPIKVLTDFMNSIDIQNMDEEDELVIYEDYFNSYELKVIKYSKYFFQTLFKTMTMFITTIKFSNQKYSNSKSSEAIALMELSKAKDFYKKEIGNMSAVGICANNIGVLHMKNQRVFEAINEMEEAIYLAKQELIEIKELKNWCKQMIAAYSEPNFYSNLRGKLQGLANKFKQLEVNLLNKLQRKKSESYRKISKNSVSFKKPNSYLSKNVSNPQMVSQRNPLAQLALLGQRNQVSNLQSGFQTPGRNKIGDQTPSQMKRVYQIEASPSKRGYVQGGFGDFVSNVNNTNKNLQEQDVLSPNQTFQKGKNPNMQNQSSLIQSSRHDPKESMIDAKKVEVIPDANVSDLTYKLYSLQDQQDSIYQNNQTEMEVLEDKLLELQGKKELTKAKLHNRQFQLAQFMFTICMQYSDVFIPETINLFEQFENAVDNTQRPTRSHMVRLINLYIKKALCYIQIGDVNKFKVEEARAEEMYNKLMAENYGVDQAIEEQEFNFVDMFKNVPNEVLQSKIMQLKAIYELLQGNFKTTAQILTNIIEIGEYYDPEVRDFCLIVLENIFQLYHIPTKPIQEFRDHISINTYEIVMMIDYSKDMSMDQINLSHSISKQIFQILQPQDLIGLYGFNDSLHESFPLQRKGVYKDLLSKQLYMAITAPGGTSRLYNAIKFAINNIFENPNQLQTAQRKFMIQATSKAAINEESGFVKEEGDEKFNPDQTQSDKYQKSRMESLMDAYASSDISSGDSNDENYQFKRKTSLCVYPDDQKVDKKNRYKFICLFTEINNYPSDGQYKRLKKQLEGSSVDLMVFNIANQNANMLDLKQLSRITQNSQFVNANTDLEKLFGKQRQNQQQKKMYLEFF